MSFQTTTQYIVSAYPECTKKCIVVNEQVMNMEYKMLLISFGKKVPVFMKLAKKMTKEN